MTDQGAWPPGGGEMARRVREHDWAATPLGQIEDWSADLKLAASLVLENRFPAALAWGPDFITIYNDAYRPILGDKPEALGRSFADIWREAWPRIGQAAERVFAGQSTFINDFPLLVHRAGVAEQAYFTFSLSPVRRADGTIVGLIDTVVETTGTVGTGEALRQSEERSRLIVENVRDYAILVSDPDDIITDWLPGAESVFGWTREEAVGQSGAITFTEEDVELKEPERAIEMAARQGSALDARWQKRKDGSLVFIEGSVIPLRHGDGSIRGFLKMGQDVTERRRADEHQKTLLGELQHRVRNTLSIVRSIARRTAQTSETVEEMSSHFQGRLDAFSRVQSVVTRNPDGGVDLGSMIEDELLAHAARESESLVMRGPEICLRPRAAESLSLAVHELTSNAVKYGALSLGGQLSVTWERKRRDGRELLRLIWEESGLDDLEPPQRQGFGMELLERSLPYDLRAETKVEFRPKGLRFEMTMPLGADVLAD